MSDVFFVNINIIGSPDELKSKWAQNYGYFHPSGQLGLIGVTIATKHIQIEDNHVKLLIVDLSGEERSSTIQTIRAETYRKTSALTITFDKGDIESFSAVNKWYQEYQKSVPQTTAPIALVGIISGSEEITAFEGQTLAEKLGASYYETKLNDKEITTEIFFNLASEVIRAY